MKTCEGNILFYKKGPFQNFIIFAGNHLQLYYKETQEQVLIFVKFLRTPIL